jgi:hypothetical protein
VDLFVEALRHSPPPAAVTQPGPEVFRTGEYNTQPTIA